MHNNCRILVVFLFLCLFSGGVVADVVVAKIGDVEYTSLNDAFAAAATATDGVTVTILQDAAMTNDTTFSFSKEVVIQGNGHVITAEYTTGNYFFYVAEPGKLKICNTTFSATPYNSYSVAMISISKNAEVELVSSTIQNIQTYGSSTASSALWVGGALIMNDSTIANCTTSSPCNTILLDGGHLEMTGGEITNCGYFGDDPGYFDAGAISAYAPAIGGEWESSSISIDGTNFSDNACGFTGAIYIYRSVGTVEIRNAVFENNKGNYVGALWISESEAVLENVRFERNESVYYGIVLADDCNSFSVDRGEFTGNQGGYGGAIYSGGTSLLLSDCVFTENKAIYGGGLYASSSKTNVSNCTIINNYASRYGGGLLKSSSSLTFSGTNVICNNSATLGGADVFNNNGSLTLTSATAMDQNYQNTGFVIDGWYDDTYTRWEPYGTGTYLGDTYLVNGQKGIIAAFTAYDQINITKTWDDTDDASGKRPKSLTFTVTDPSGTPVKLRKYDEREKKWIAGGADAQITLTSDDADSTGNVWTGSIAPLLVGKYSDASNFLLRESETGELYRLKAGDPEITFTPYVAGGEAGKNAGIYQANFTNIGPDPSISYFYAEGQDSSWQKESGQTILFRVRNSVRAKGIYELFAFIEVDGEKVDPDNYSLKEEQGSVIIELKPSFLETLSLGKHTLRTGFTDGYADTEFNVVSAEAKSDSLPGTGDSSRMNWWIVLALGGIAGAVIMGRKSLHIR